MTTPGYRLVPEEPTDTQVEAGLREWSNIRDIYKAMLAAAPQPEPQHLTRNQQAAVQQALIASGEHLYDVQPEPPADLMERARDLWESACNPDHPNFDQHVAELIAAFAQEHAASEKARAEKAEKALWDAEISLDPEHETRWYAAYKDMLADIRARAPLTPSTLPQQP
jgi:hypothetical protein